MRKGRFVVSAVGIAAGIAVLLPVTAMAEPLPDGGPKVGQHWLSRLDPGLQIPRDLALRFARAAVAKGLTKTQAARMLNDERFAAAVGSPDQGYGLLEAMIGKPEHIWQAYELLADPHVTASGADSLRNALMLAVPKLRNAYLGDLGLMAVEGPTGIMVLLDLETGRQYLGQGLLGAQLRGPGGGPLPEPEVSPHDGTADMGERAEDPAAVEIQRVPSGPGLNVSSKEPQRGLITQGLYLVIALFALAWAGFVVKAIARRIHSRPLRP